MASEGYSSSYSVSPFRRGSRRGRSLFLQAFLADPSVVGSVVPSSKHLADALVQPFRAQTSPANVLEIGAGTGVVTRRLGRELGPKDQLSICECQPALADHIERQVLAEPYFAPAVREGRVRLLRCPVQEIDPDERYDQIICGLPFTAFGPGDVSSILRLIRRSLLPGGTFSYFEYIALRRVKLAAATGKKRQRMRRVSAILDAYIRRFEIGRRKVLINFPPAYARYWRFD